VSKDRAGAGEGVVEALGGLAAALEEPAGRSRFLRGLAVGALLGAAAVGAILGMGARRGHPTTSGRSDRQGRDSAPRS
jgi:hypothetical protein